MTQTLLACQRKYLTFDVNGEEASFNEDYLEKEEEDLHSDMTELMEKGWYYTHNKPVLDRMTAILIRENLRYQVVPRTGTGLKLELQFF